MPNGRSHAKHEANEGRCNFLWELSIGILHGLSLPAQKHKQVITSLLLIHFTARTGEKVVLFLGIRFDCKQNEVNTQNNPLS